ncbi:hypothetical protein QYE76_000677 [Lolium multiflorum]|uniref:DUF4216 domain-containing protein n=1 Tax=Lolium multiflorum TaxID=4521 RepID=A0AAD8RKL6_LOLMU|nr:hypothetical protein QYE76_000677 [Lolium multiflorum]
MAAVAELVGRPPPPTSCFPRPFQPPPPPPLPRLPPAPSACLPLSRPSSRPALPSASLRPARPIPHSCSIKDAETSEDPEENTKEYYEALFASQKPLHENTEVTQLDAIARLMALKCHRNLCRDGFDELLVIVGSLLPKGHLLPQNFYYSTKLLSDLKMSSQQIHACPKGCMLFREEHADTNYCIKCNSSRYFEVDRNGDGQKRQTTVAKNILRYLPVLPRIQRLFMTEDTAQQMRWAVEGNRYTDKMIHPSDGTAWKNFVKKFPLKAGDPRSVAVAISTDGFNPYGMSAAVYSCWPVFVIPMNLPPGVCMRSENMFVSMIIPGPKYPGKNMNVYLEPLVDDLVRGWEGRGIRTYDASKKEYFDMYVWYHTSLHDLPARALFCGWCTHGKWPCPQCRQAVTFFWLNKGGKYSCFDEARQFLERRHAYRSDVKSFKKGRVVRGPKPIPKTGTEIKAELDALKPSPDGNGFLGYGETHQWTHKPCLWKLPYFEFLELPHNIDVMHTEKNISEAIWSTIVDTEKTKDNIKARIDQEMWCDRPELNMQPPHGAKKTWTKPHAPFCLTKAQKREVFQWMKDSLFFPDGFAANWMRGLNIETLRVQGLKSHDYHIWLERIMPIEASIAEAVLNVEVANFTTKHYDPNIPTKHNPVLRYNAANNEEVPKLSIFVGLGGKSSGSKPYRTDLQERTLIHSYVLNTMVEVKPYIEQFKAIHWKNTHREPTPEESKQIFDKGGGFGFSSWFCNLARTDKEMKSELRKIARGFDHSLEAFNSYDVNGYRFQTHKYTTSRPNAKTINSGVVCQGDDGLHYYGRVEDIYELNYGFQKGLNPVVFKCHWFDPRRVRRDPEIGLVEVERNSVYKGEDVYILATQAFQVFYLPYACRNPTKRLHGWDVVMTVPSRNRPPPPNKDDYRRVDPSAKSVEFYQEEGLPGHFTIALPTIDDMVVDDEQEDAGMDGDNAEDEAEDVCAPEDLSLLEAFRAGIDLDADGPPPGFIDDYCSFKYEDPSQRPPRGYSNILGGLLRWYFPGIVNFPTGGCDVAWRWAHYSLAEDPMGRGTAADLVVAKFWKYFKRAEGKENACDDVLHQLARKRVTGMHYEARVQCVRDWHADRFVHMTKEDARDTLMQPWQYMQNPPQYVGNDERCFLAMVMWWTCPQYLKKHEEGKKKRAEMRGGSHIQGSIPISLHLQNEEVRTGAKPNVFAVLKKMKQRKTPDPETGSVWVNPQSETQCTSYVSKFKQKYGEDANPEAEDFDPEVAVLAGEGLKHGRLWFGDGCVDPARVPSLRQIRRGRKSGQPEVEPRPRASDLAVERLREEMAAKEQAAQEQRAQMEQQILEYQQQQTQMMQQMQQKKQMMQQQQHR